MGNDILNAALNKYKEGDDVKNEQFQFGGPELFNDVTKNKTFYTIPGFVGSARITINQQEEGIHIIIFNITSLTSGDILKNPYDSKNWVNSIQRPSDKKKKIPKYSNIGQFYFLFIPYNDEIKKR